MLSRNVALNKSILFIKNIVKAVNLFQIFKEEEDIKGQLVNANLVRLLTLINANMYTLKL